MLGGGCNRVRRVSSLNTCVNKTCFSVYLFGLNSLHPELYNYQQ